MSQINFYTADKAFVFKGKRKLKLFIEHIFKMEATKISQIDYIFCSDEYLLSINKAFLQHDYYTDIITFDLSEKKQPKSAEIYISIERVAENAKNLSVQHQTELLRVIFHGALHLCGYKDKKDTDIKKMRKKEDFYLTSFKK
jgi:rRNA maturation RNase YbeY